MIRRAQDSDADACAELTLMAGANELRCFFPVDETGILRMLVALYAKEDVLFSRSNLWVEEQGGVARGAMLLIPGARKRRAERAVGGCFRELIGALGIVGVFRMIARAPLARVFDVAEDDELYINSIAVYPRFRGQKVASALLAAAGDHAKELGLDKVSLVVELRNAHAIDVYRGAGYSIARTVSLGAHYSARHLVGFHKMVRSL